MLDLAWSKRPEDLRFALVGPKEISFWNPADVTKKLQIKGTFGKQGQTSLLCVAFDEEGWCYTGGDNGLIQLWANDNAVAKTIKAHSASVTAIATDKNKLLSGSKDQKVAIITILGAGNFKLEKLIDLSSITPSLPLPIAKSLDFYQGNLLVGLRNGTILELKSALEPDSKEQPQIKIQSHFTGEAWGLASAGNNKIVTCCDDNRVLMFDTQAHAFVRGGKVSDKQMNSLKKSTAESASKMPPNKQARAVAVSLKHNHLALASNLGKVSIRSFDDFDQKLQSLKEAKQWC